MEQALQIETGKELSFKNLASFRKKMSQYELQTEVTKFMQILKEKGAQKKGPMIWATFGIETIDRIQIFDVEYLVPIDIKLNNVNNITIKPVFHISNAIYYRYIGDLSDINSAYSELMKHIQHNHYQQITVGYNVNVNVNDEEIILGKKPIIDIYIGLNPNIL